ncbi:hypothetical protein Tco_0058932 [Tanacetum coccineum]
MIHRCTWLPLRRTALDFLLSARSISFSPQVPVAKSVKLVDSILLMASALFVFAPWFLHDGKFPELLASVFTLFKILIMPDSWGDIKPLT